MTDPSHSTLGGHPLVSIIISSHNYEEWVAEAVRSALDQTYENVEVIVCDDGSVDGSVEILNRLSQEEPRLVVVTDRNRGQGAALSKAAGAACGEILCFLDADDTFLPTKVETIVRLFEAAPEAGLAIHRLTAVDTQGVALQDLPQFASLRGGDLRQDVLRRGGRWVTVPSTGLSMRAQWKEAVFPIPDQLRTAADAFVFGLLPLLAPVVASSEVLARYRIHGANSYGTARPDLATAKRALSEISLVNRLVNDRLGVLGDDARVVLEDNLAWHVAAATCSLLEGDPRARKLSWDAARRIQKDDLWPRAVRATLASLFRIAPFLPRNLRSRWLGAAFGLSSLKRRIGRLKLS